MDCIVGICKPAVYTLSDIIEPLDSTSTIPNTALHSS